MGPTVNAHALVQPDGALRIYVPRPTPSLNEWNGKRWFAKARLKTEWHTTLVLLVGGNRTRPTERKRVHIERRGKRDLDHDNLWAGCKPVLDAMTACALIHDDAPKWLDLHVTQRRPEKGEEPSTVILVEEIL